MSKVEVDKIDPQSGTALEIGSSGDTATIPSGATFTIASGATLTNSGTATGFFEGIAWQAVTTGSTLTTVAGKGYPINTTSNACTVTLPGSASVGDQVQIVDYAGTFATYNVTLTSTLKIEGGTDDKILTTNREGVTITYVDVTQGWVATSGVNSGDQAIDPITYSADFLVVGGGASGGFNSGGSGGRGGGGAGGYRTSTQTLNAGTVYTVTVGDGGTGTTSSNSSGSNSSISGSGITTITSAGGGTEATAGGSGGGAYGTQTPGAGNTPSTDPVQGYAGGTGINSGPNYGGGGGGGASAVGVNGTTTVSGAGGAGSASSITGASVTYAGGGGGATYLGGSGGAGGSGGGGAGGIAGNAGVNGTVNLGGGGGGAGADDTVAFKGGNGGKGVVILSVPDASYSGTTTGSPTVATDVGGTGKTSITFTGDGTYTA